MNNYKAAGNIVEWNHESRILIILTPIMKRARSLRSSSELVFADSTSACDEKNHAVTFFFTACAADAVPLGVCISDGMSTQKYEAAFRMFANCLGHVAFNEKGYPQVFMTDDSDVEREAIRRVWPNSRSLLCLFHVGQSIWRWLWSAANGVAHDDRPVLKKMFCQVIYATSEEEAQTNYRSAVNSEVGNRYVKWLHYLDSYWKRRELWCLAYRKSAVLRGNHTNNYCESSIRLFKDIVLSRTKAYNQIALIDHVVTIMERYYERRLLEFAHSRNTKPYLLLDRVLKAAAATTVGDIWPVDDGFFYVNEVRIITTLISKLACALVVPECLEYSANLKPHCIAKEIVFRTRRQFSKEDRYEIAKLAISDNCKSG